jgi:hypothetical protein
LGVTFPVALSLISRRGRKTKNNGRVVSSIAWNYFGILKERKKERQESNQFHVELLCNDQVFFEILKMKIRSVSIVYSIKQSRDEKEENIKT